MLNFNSLWKKGFDGLMGLIGFEKRHTQIVPVGAGYWGFKRNISKAGIAYTQLVKRDQSRPYQPIVKLDLEPQVGMRHPEKRKGRRADKAQIQLSKAKDGS